MFLIKNECGDIFSGFELKLGLWVPSFEDVSCGPFKAIIFPTYEEALEVLKSLEETDGLEMTTIIKI